MAGETQAGWLNSFAALWNADGLAAWAARLAVLLVAVLAVAALSSLGRRRVSARAMTAPAAPRRIEAAPGFAPATLRTVPPKNKKKKPEGLVRRYRPQCVSGTQRPVRRNKPAAVALELLPGGQLQPKARKAV